MQKYISKVVNNILTKNTDTTHLTIILPNKRAGVFVKEALKRNINSFSFLPIVTSIEDFIQDLSKIQTIDNVTILFEFYKIYIKNTPKNKVDSFDDFSNWATILLQDFNEIDQFLIDPNYIFSYIKDIKRIESWFTKDKPQTTLTKNYLSFFDYVEVYYIKLYAHLLKLKKGYQGLQYREAEKNVVSYIADNTTQRIALIGFNALNKAEENIFKKLLDNKIATIYFDIDQFFITEKLTPSNFITKYKTKWNYFQKNDLHTTNEFSGKKEIKTIGIPKNVSQIKQVGNILKNELTRNSNYTNIALVLANEDLLSATLNSLPKEVENVNITMGYPLKNMVLSDFFSLLFKLHQNKKKIGKNKTFYFKDVISILNHPNIKSLSTSKITQTILKNNLIFITKNKLVELANKQNVTIINTIFSNWNNCHKTIQSCIYLIELLKITTNNKLEIEYFNRFYTLFQQLQNLNDNYGYITTLDGLYNLYKQLLSTETLSFKGESLKGLQIMGMLETRMLDFETVIITSVNEGFLPAGKSNNSFIPFDVKREVGLPTYHEKDAIFSYHFYRLLARAKTIYLLYNTETDDFGSGEQSRFITQLEVLQNKLPNHHFTKTIVSPKVKSEHINLKQIKKTKPIWHVLQEQAKKGFSPTSLTNYMYNPIAFYKQKILKIYPLEEVEETIAVNTLGTVIHRTLEDFYLPFKATFLQEKHILEMKKNSTKKIALYFAEEFKNGDVTKGKNLLIFEVAKQYISNFLNQELQLLKSGKQLKIIDLEVNLKSTLTIKEISFPIKIIGQADRIDQLDGVTRIIDYKTGKVTQTDLNIKNWEQITTNYKKYNKVFQVLMYAYMYTKTNKISLDSKAIESGIISFKNLNSGFLKVNKTTISNEDMINFEMELKKLIVTIYNKEIPFIENENLPY